MITRIWIASKMTLVLTVLLGILYPILLVALGQLFFPFQANGSLLVRNGQVVGSILIGQDFHSPKYFHPRPSAAGDKGYDATASGGSNLAPTNKTLISNARSRLASILSENPGIKPQEVPVELVTASGSGLDPDISPAAAMLQAARIARARNLELEDVKKLIQSHTRGRWMGLFGEPRVNVLELNIALDEMTQDKKR